MKFGRFILTAIYFIFSIYMFYDFLGGFYVAGFGIMNAYVCAVGFIIVTFWYFLLKPDIDRMAAVLKYSLVLMIPYLFSIFWSFGLWVLNLAEFRMITRGVFFPVYQLIAILMAASTIYCFGWKGIYYLLGSFFAAYVLLLLGLIRQGGLAEFITECVTLFTSGSLITGPLMAQLEDPNFPQAVGLLMMFLLVTMKGNRKNIVLFLLCMIPFFLGFKRSTMLAIVGSCMIGYICLKLPRQYRETCVIAVSAAAILGAVAYMGALYFGLVQRAADWLGIDTMGRLDLYKAMTAYYDFSPFYLGRGSGFASYMIGGGFIDVGTRYAGDIHNDFLRLYIELGMAGFIIWLSLFFVYRVKFFLKEAGLTCAVLILICNIYCFFCYLTENMYYRFYSNVALAIVIIAMALKESERRKRIGRE